MHENAKIHNRSVDDRPPIVSDDGILLSAAFSALLALILACGIGGYYVVAATSRLARAAFLTSWGL